MADLNFSHGEQPGESVSGSALILIVSMKYLMRLREIRPVSFFHILLT